MNLIIGCTSQLAHYFPKDDYVRISSRNVDFNFLNNNSWDSVYLTFGELRIYDENIDYFTPNYVYTLNIINSLIDKSKRIVVYSSGELWNKCVGKVTMYDDVNYYSFNCDYLPSKEKLMKTIIDLRKTDDRYNKVILMHPLYFNSVQRSDYFLLGKVFKSIIYKKKIEVGNTYFHRDIVHTKYVVEKSMSATSDLMIGSGRLYFINDFIRDLYKFFNMKYEDYVIENPELKKINSFEKLYYSDQVIPCTYNQLFEDTTNDIINFLKNERSIHFNMVI